MITAQEIKKELQVINQCQGLDVWITGTIKPLFIRSMGTPITVDTKLVSWPPNPFEAAMRLRGFNVAWECADRPCSSPYWTISLD